MAMGLMANYYHVRNEGRFLGTKEENQKISGSSLAPGMTAWGFFSHLPCFSKSSPMIRIK
jgi:hypothetical protein